MASAVHFDVNATLPLAEAVESAVRCAREWDGASPLRVVVALSAGLHEGRIAVAGGGASGGALRTVTLEVRGPARRADEAHAATLRCDGALGAVLDVSGSVFSSVVLRSLQLRHDEGSHDGAVPAVRIGVDDGSDDAPPSGVRGGEGNMLLKITEVIIRFADLTSAV